MEADVRMGRGFVLGGAVLLAGCQSFFPPLTTTTTTPSTTGNFVYVANGVGSVAGFGVSATTAGTGQLTAVTGSPFGLQLSPTAMAIPPGNGFLYVAGIGGIYAYTIATGTGVLSLAGGGAQAITTYPAVSLDVSPNGQWLFALSQDGVTLTEYAINATTGALALQRAVQYTAANGATVVPKMVKVSPNGAFVALALGTGGDVIFPLTTSTGVLGTTYQQIPPVSATASDNALTIDGRAAFLYIARSGTGGGVVVYAFGSGGGLTGVAGSPFASGAGAFAVQLDATGKYLYVANRTDGTISGYTVGTGGVLTALGGSPYTSGTLVTSLARDSSGKYLFAAAAGGAPDLSMYGFDGTVAGKLDAAATAATGADPVAALVVAATR